MPVTKTAKRALRNSIRKRAQNYSIIKKIDILKRIFKKRPTEDSFRKLVSEIDKAVRKKVIHKNKASRIKNRFSRLIVKKRKNTQTAK